MSGPANDCWGSDLSLHTGEGRSQLHPTGDGTSLTSPMGGPVPTGQVAAVPLVLHHPVPTNDTASLKVGPTSPRMVWKGPSWGTSQDLGLDGHLNICI